MSLSDEIVSIIDNAKTNVQEVLAELDPDNYMQFYNKIWTARADIEFLVVSIKLLNNLEYDNKQEKWKEEFADSLVQVRADRKIRKVFEETIELFNELETIQDIELFYRQCWKIKEKLTILLNVVKPKIKPKYKSKS
jgi:hypothetical protein